MREICLCFFRSYQPTATLAHHARMFINSLLSYSFSHRLLLPDYGSDYEKLKNLLGRAVMECEGFGLE